MKILFAVCSDVASVDSTTNRLSLFNVVEEIQSASFPTVLPSISFVLLLEKTTSEADELELRLIGSLNNSKLFNFPLQASFQGKKRLRAIANLQGIPLDAPGDLTIAAKHKGKPIGAWNVEVKSIGIPAIAKQLEKVEAGTSTSNVGAKRTRVRKIKAKATGNPAKKPPVKSGRPAKRKQSGNRNIKGTPKRTRQG